MPEYLFVRINEACNAGCFMCDFAKSHDTYRLDRSLFKQAIPRLRQEGIRYVRFTGGEPLLHREISGLVADLSEQGIKTSIISNGALLLKRLPELVKAGLSQIIVSVDGMNGTHDTLRGVQGLFNRCSEGLAAARENGVHTRVNSVVGPRNYADMPALQRYLSTLGVMQWEMSSLKIGKRLDYSTKDRRRIERDIVPQIFGDGKAKGLLVPFGKIWCGGSSEERELYFSTGVTPRADDKCHVVDHVRYFDAKNLKLYACSLIPHRNECERLFPAPVSTEADLSTVSPEIERQAAFFKDHGPTRCTGCSTTAAGLSNMIHAGKRLKEWSF